MRAPPPPLPFPPPRPRSLSSFYEKQARQNGLPRLDESSVLPAGEASDTEAAVESAASYSGGSRGILARGRRSMEMEREREGMQEAASATVSYRRMTWR